MIQAPASPFARFTQSLDRPDVVGFLSQGLIGEGHMIDGPFGPKPLIYVDYVASGRALRQIETFVMEDILPVYANSHTEASHCGSQMTRMRQAARRVIARHCGADDSFATIFTGSGATAGLNRLVHLLGVADAATRGENPLVLIGPYEHHSNILPWRESGAEVIEIPESSSGGPDLSALENHLQTAKGRLVIGSFSAASNVTGILTDVDAVSTLLNRYGARVVWDYAGGGPYLPIAMNPGLPSQKDAIVMSCHKFAGGPGASGVMVVRRATVTLSKPVFAGGGTVRFVSPWGHDYSADVTAREEAGTPNVIGDIRAALCILVKEAIGQAHMSNRHEELRQRAQAVWKDNPAIEVLGNPDAACLPIFSFRIKNIRDGGYIHQQLFTKMLSDVHGVQARGGCACAGPYAHRLLGIDTHQSEALRTAILSGEEMEKPGWTRLNFSALMCDDKADAVINAVDALARDPNAFASTYDCDRSTARFRATST